MLRIFQTIFNVTDNKHTHIIFHNKTPNMKNVGNNQWKKELKDLLMGAIIQYKITSMTSIILDTDKQM
jgi:hypothetical protein